MRKDVGVFLDKFIKAFETLNIDNVDSLILFGSQARGTALVSSDIDIAVVMTEPLTHRQRGELICLPDEVDDIYDVDLYFTTKVAVDTGDGIFNTNKYIREEGLKLWPL